MLNLPQIKKGLSATAIATLLLSTTAQADMGCPATLHQAPVMPDAKFCQLFNEELPASLTYHAPSDIPQAADYYLQQLGDPDSDVTVKGRRVLQFSAGQKIIVLSEDGNGTQVDMLIK
ncbi:hypothetical protein QX776_05010 [Alteromonadaceae bacterium BrNp21-10]|nr:hypothetical protein [Alteromonadaceae bacterium BrNp21-10]